VSAPAGSGKTFLLRSWAGAAGLADSVAWVAVQGRERDPQRFWISVAGALRDTIAGAKLVRELSAAPDLDGWAVVERLLEDLDALEDRIWLVIDDVHELSFSYVRHRSRQYGQALPVQAADVPGFPRTEVRRLGKRAAVDSSPGTHGHVSRTATLRLSGSRSLPAKTTQIDRSRSLPARPHKSGCSGRRHADEPAPPDQLGCGPGSPVIAASSPSKSSPHGPQARRCAAMPGYRCSAGAPAATRST
jgi:hypothetical protein